MRLIDADKFMEQLKDDINNMEDPRFIICTQAITHDLARQATVEAMPIEWIKSWFSYQQWLGSAMTDRIHCKASDIIDDWYEEQNRRRWEKENGTDRQR